jgi:hypothetical protein
MYIIEIPLKGTPTLTKGLRGQMILVGTPMLDRSKVMALTKWGTVVLHVGGWA